jgi:hypothetical protein
LQVPDQPLGDLQARVLLIQRNPMFPVSRGGRIRGRGPALMTDRGVPASAL